MKIFKIMPLIFTLTFSLAAGASAYTGNEGGGGDTSEVVVNNIRADILKWINEGGAKKLKLPKELIYKDYHLKMTDILQNKKVIIGFIESDDDKNTELQVNVGGVPKTCRSFYSKIDLLPHIVCNISRFEKTSDSEKYVLLHHEYAGLVGVEKNEGAASDYLVSSQMTGFLTLQTVLRLAVSPEKKTGRTQRCENVYLNYYKEDDKIEKEAAIEIKKYFAWEFGIQIFQGWMYEGEAGEISEGNEQYSLAKNSTIISLNSETDFTGSEIAVSVYNTNQDGAIIFNGSKMESATFKKTKREKLIELAKSAIIFSCGLKEYL